jgi:hypothetical protein
MMDKAYCFAFFQKNPKSKPKIIGVLELINEKIIMFTKNGEKPYKASLVTQNGHILMSNSVEFLKELAKQSKISQITYEFSEDFGKAEVYKQSFTSL